MENKPLRETVSRWYRENLKVAKAGWTTGSTEALEHELSTKEKDPLFTIPAYRTTGSTHWVKMLFKHSNMIPGCKKLRTTKIGSDKALKVA